MDLFHTATFITIGNGLKTPFRHAPWLEGSKPKNIAPLIFECSNKKNCSVGDAMNSNAWVGNVRLDENFTLNHLSQFVALWMLLLNVHLVPDIVDEIRWKLTENGEYSAKTAYTMQFMGTIASPMGKTVWRAWGPPKTKFFLWLAWQNRLWTADRLARRGWPNCGACPLCKQTMESVSHLFVHCRVTQRVWNFIIHWLGLHTLQPLTWTTLSFNEWWSLLTDGSTPCRKAITTVALLTTWEIWNERNARVFKNKSSPPTVVFDRIKREARLWVLAGAKCLGNLIPRE